MLSLFDENVLVQEEKTLCSSFSNVESLTSCFVGPK